MTQRKFIRFLVLILGILTANLVTTLVDEYFLSHKGEARPFIFTWIGMLVVVAVYYPLFTHIDMWSVKLSDSMLKKGRSLVGKNYGIYLFFIVALFVLYYFYGKMWYKFNVLESFLNFVTS